VVVVAAMVVVVVVPAVVVVVAAVVVGAVLVVAPVEGTLVAPSGAEEHAAVSRPSASRGATALLIGSQRGGVGAGVATGLLLSAPDQVHVAGAAQELAV